MKKIISALALALMALSLVSCGENEEITTGTPGGVGEPEDVTTPGYSWVVEDNHSSTPLPVTEKGEVALKEKMDMGISIYVSDKDGAYLREDAYTIRVLNADKVDTHVIYYEKAQNWNNDPNPVISLFVSPVGGGETSVQVEVATKGDQPQVVMRRTFKFIVPGEKTEEVDDVATPGYSWEVYNFFEGLEPLLIPETGEVEIHKIDYGLSFYAKGPDGHKLGGDAYTVRVANAQYVDTNVVVFEPNTNEEGILAEYINAVGPGTTSVQVEFATKGAKPQVVLRRTFKIIVTDKQEKEQEEEKTDTEQERGKGTTLSKSGNAKIPDTSLTANFDVVGDATMTYYDNGTFGMEWGTHTTRAEASVLQYYSGQGEAVADHNFVLDYSYAKKGYAGGYGHVGAACYLPDDDIVLRVVEDYMSYRPSDLLMRQYYGKKIGTIEVDGSNYDVYVAAGGSYDVWHIRTEGRQQGQISMSEHLRKLRALCGDKPVELLNGTKLTMKLEKLGFVGMSAVVMNSNGSTGSVDITKFVLKDN